MRRAHERERERERERESDRERERARERMTGETGTRDVASGFGESERCQLIRNSEIVPEISHLGQ